MVMKKNKNTPQYIWANGWIVPSQSQYTTNTAADTVIIEADMNATSAAFDTLSNTHITNVFCAQ